MQSVFRCNKETLHDGPLVKRDAVMRIYQNNSPPASDVNLLEDWHLHRHQHDQDIDRNDGKISTAPLHFPLGVPFDNPTRHTRNDTSIGDNVALSSLLPENVNVERRIYADPSECYGCSKTWRPVKLMSSTLDEIPAYASQSKPQGVNSSSVQYSNNVSKQVSHKHTTISSFRNQTPACFSRHNFTPSHMSFYSDTLNPQYTNPVSSHNAFYTQKFSAIPSASQSQFQPLPLILPPLPPYQLSFTAFPRPPPYDKARTLPLLLPPPTITHAHSLSLENYSDGLSKAVSVFNEEKQKMKLKQVTPFAPGRFSSPPLPFQKDASSLPKSSLFKQIAKSIIPDCHWEGGRLSLQNDKKEETFSVEGKAMNAIVDGRYYREACDSFPNGMNESNSLTDNKKKDGLLMGKARKESIHYKENSTIKSKLISRQLVLSTPTKTEGKAVSKIALAMSQLSNLKQQWHTAAKNGEYRSNKRQRKSKRRRERKRQKKSYPDMRLERKREEKKWSARKEKGEDLNLNYCNERGGILAYPMFKERPKKDDNTVTFHKMEEEDEEMDISEEEDEELAPAKGSYQMRNPVTLIVVDEGDSAPEITLQSKGIESQVIKAKSTNSLPLLSTLKTSAIPVKLLRTDTNRNNNMVAADDVSKCQDIKELHTSMPEAATLNHQPRDHKEIQEEVNVLDMQQVSPIGENSLMPHKLPITNVSPVKVPKELSKDSNDQSKAFLNATASKVNHLESLAYKKARLERALKKIEFEKAKAKLRRVQIKNQEELKAILHRHVQKIDDRSSTSGKKVIMLTSSAINEKSSVTMKEHRMSTGLVLPLEKIEPAATARYQKRIVVTAFKMRTLTITRIEASGHPDKVRPVRPISVLLLDDIDLKCSRNSSHEEEEMITNPRAARCVLNICKKIKSDRLDSGRSFVIPTFKSLEDKSQKESKRIKLNLKLLKSRLQLKILEKAKVTKRMQVDSKQLISIHQSDLGIREKKNSETYTSSTTVKNKEESSFDNLMNLDHNQSDNKFPISKSTPCSLSLENISTKGSSKYPFSVIKSGGRLPLHLKTHEVQELESTKVSQNKETIDELRQRQSILQDSIDSSREANEELKYEKKVSDLTILVQKQQKMLKYHGYKISESKLSLKKYSEQFIEERDQIYKSEEKLRKMFKRKKVLENMVLAVTKTLVDGRRKRGVMLKRFEERRSN